MPGLNELSPDERDRLTSAFASARALWGPRARFARQIGVDASSVQALEGKKASNLSDDLIERLTIAVGWPGGHWRTVAAGGLSVIDSGDRPLEELVKELAQRVAELERSVDAQTQSRVGEENQDDPSGSGA